MLTFDNEGDKCPKSEQQIWRIELNVRFYDIYGYFVFKLLFTITSKIGSFDSIVRHSFHDPNNFLIHYAILRVLISLKGLWNIYQYLATLTWCISVSPCSKCEINCAWLLLQLYWLVSWNLLLLYLKCVCVACINYFKMFAVNYDVLNTILNHIVKTQIIKLPDFLLRLWVP